MTTLIKLNYRHSLETMRNQLSNHNETFTYSMQDGKPLFTLKEANDIDNGLTKTCGYFNSFKDLAEYINKRNGFI